MNPDPRLPSESADSPAAHGNASSPGDSGREGGVLYPSIYVWYVFLASLDVMFTWIVLYMGGREVNTLADWILDLWGLPGLVSYKFLLVMFVVGVCEVVGRRKHELGRRLGEWAVALSTIPVLLALLQLMLRVHC